MTAPIEPISDEALAELEKIASYREPSFINQKVCNGTILALIARLRAAEVDARRYRWLRDKQTFIWLIQDWFPKDGEMTDVDAEIDATMERTP